jgi:MoaA/NifB/PqqE/SkfB family radical SAM enzyme
MMANVKVFFLLVGHRPPVLPVVYDLFFIFQGVLRTYMNQLLQKDHFTKKLLIAEIVSKPDDVLLRELLTDGEINHEQMIIFKRRFSGSLKLRSYPKALFSEIPHATYENREQFLNWLKKYTPKDISLWIWIQLQNTDLPSDALTRAYRKFCASKSPHVFVDFGQFTNASFEFIAPTETKNYELPFISDKAMNLYPDKYEYSYYYKTQFKKYFQYPKSISVDLSPACNKTCDKCQYHSKRSPYRNWIDRNKQMPVELVYKILDEASIWTPKPTLAPTFSGEPLLYAKLPEIVRYAKKLGLPVSITTNGLLLTKEKSKLLFDAGADSFLFSIDAHTKETYSLLQPPGSLEKVQENIANLLGLRGNQQFPSIGVHFVMEERNQHEFSDYLKYWSHRVDFVSRAIYQNQFEYNQLTLSPFLPLRRKQACWGPWTSIYIRYDGRISFCGFDISGQHKKLNVSNMSLEEIWNSDEYWQWRNAHLETDRQILYCKACPDWSCQRSIEVYEGDFHILRTPVTENYVRMDKVHQSQRNNLTKIIKKFDKNPIVPEMLIESLVRLYRIFKLRK